MTEDKLLELVKRIGEKTERAGLNWEKTAREAEFQAQLSTFVIRISRVEVNQEEYDYCIRLIDKDGVTIETVSDADLSKIEKESTVREVGFNAYKLLDRIYKLAKRQALGVDKAIDKILSELG